ncbi:hypothetical protein [Bartonella apis]|uniref:hypothetical protein n=1 Tax=Bartonella apis TaxID=1686310 RepID=UPI002432D108|nr:hypothetical protein [Bartonella apis]
MWIGILSALIAAAVSYIVCCRNNYISTVTSERTKWLTNLREASALMICLLENMYYSGEADRHPQDIKDLKCQCYIVIMQLNPDDEDEKNLVQKILKIEKCALSREPEYIALIEELVFNFQRLLKDTWEQIKFEAKPWYQKIYEKLQKKFS